MVLLYGRKKLFIKAKLFITSPCIDVNTAGMIPLPLYVLVEGQVTQGVQVIGAWQQVSALLMQLACHSIMEKQ